jgi:antirestriction protein ArdC
MNKQEIFENITSQIKEKLEQGTLPWRRSWKTGVPMNLLSKRPYSGINFLSLSLNDFASPYYLTFLQCKEKGGSINKGEHGSLIVYWTMKDFNVGDLPGSEVKQYPLLRYSRAFNLSQTSLYHSHSEDTLITEYSLILNNLAIQPVIKNNTRGCFYSPDEDYISIPQASDFDSTEEYFASLFHELIHWTGHPSRMSRLSVSTGGLAQALEELVAELGAVYLCGLCGIAPAVIDNGAAYIQSWLNYSNSNPLFFVDASLQAQKAVNYLLNTNTNLL